MNNFSQPGDVLTLTAPAGGVLSGKAFKIGSLVVIAAKDADATVTFPAATKGVFRVTKLDDEAWDEGDPIYFQAVASPVGASYFTAAVGSPAGVLVGVAAEAIPASPPIATGLVRLDGVVR